MKNNRGKLLYRISIFRNFAAVKIKVVSRRHETA